MRFKSIQGFQIILEGTPTRWSISVFFDGMGMRWPWWSQCGNDYDNFWRSVSQPAKTQIYAHSPFLHHSGKQSSFKRENTSGVRVYRPGHTYSYWKFSAVFDRTGSILKKPFASIFFIVMFYLLSEKIEAKARRPHICKYIKVSFLETFKNWNTSPSNFFQCKIFWFCHTGKSLAFARLKFGRSFVCQYF